MVRTRSQIVRSGPIHLLGERGMVSLVEEAGVWEATPAGSGGPVIRSTRPKRLHVIGPEGVQTIPLQGGRKRAGLALAALLLGPVQYILLRRRFTHGNQR